MHFIRFQRLGRCGKWNCRSQNAETTGEFRVRRPTLMPGSAVDGSVGFQFGRDHFEF